MHRTKTSHCLNCLEPLDAATGILHDHAPTPGAITICFRCGHIMAFDDDLSFRQLTDQEMHDVAGDPRILAVQHARAEVLDDADR
jgi:hypothetical protein